MSGQSRHARLARAIGASLVAFVLGCSAVSAQSDGPIKIGVLAPLTGPLATPGKDMADGLKLFWEQNNYRAGGRKVELVLADTTCNPDQALTQARRVVHQDKVHFILGPLCGHEGPAVAQVSKETGIPVVMDPAGADDVTKWKRTPSVIRTAISSSQIGHPFGDYLYKDIGARNVTFIAQDYTFGHEVALGAVETLLSGLSAVGLGERADHKVMLLSYGERRQLELALALGTRPKVLFLDEPCAGLSPSERRRLFALVRDLPREITLVMIEHDMDVALGIADRVTVMNRGQVMAEGTPEQIQADPDVRDVYFGHA